MTRLVVVDDDAEIRELLERALTRAGHVVHAVGTGEEALELLSPEVDCLVVDKILPGVGGLEVMSEARKRHPGLPVVLVTGHPEPFQLGADRPDAVVIKPFTTLAAVAEAVASAIEARRTAAPASLRDRVAAAVAGIAPTLRKKDKDS